MSYERHPLSAAWPDMAREDFDALVASIEAHGLREPITLMDGKVLDGWHRYQACESLGIKGATVDFNGTAEDAENLINDRHTRRNITPIQRAAAGLKMFEWRTGSGGHNAKANRNVTVCSVQQIAEKQGVSKSTVEKAKAAVKADPEALDKIRKGEETAGTILKKAKPPATPQKPVEKPEAPAVTQAPVNDAQDEIMRDYERLLADNQRLTAIVESTDAGKAALAEVKRLTEVVRVLEERNRGLMNEKNRALEQAKMWMRKAQRAEKAAKEAAEGVAF